MSDYEYGSRDIDEGEILVRDVMNYPVVTCKPSETVREIARKMAEKGIGSIVIVNGRNIVIGIITEGDIVRRVVAAGLDPAKTIVETVMTANPIVVSEDWPLYRAADLMASKNIGHLPVVDASGRPIGIVTKTDIARLAPNLLAKFFLK